MQKREDLKKAPFSLPTKHQVRASEMRGQIDEKHQGIPKPGTAGTMLRLGSM
jgi:hypothetical protein